MLLTSMDIRLTSGHLACYHYSQDSCILEKEMAKKSNKECAETYYNCGLAHSKKDELELVIADYTKAINLKPDYADAYYNRGVAYRIKGDYKLAITDYTKAIEIEPNNADAYYRRSRAWLHIGDPEKAKSDMAIASNIGVNTTTALDEILRDYDRAWKTLGNISDI